MKTPCQLHKYGARKTGSLEKSTKTLVNKNSHFEQIIFNSVNVYVVL